MDTEFTTLIIDESNKLLSKNTKPALLKDSQLYYGVFSVTSL